VKHELVGRERVEAVGRAVVDYLGQHENAMDSFEGIARFWIPRQRLQAELQALEIALTELVQADVLEALELESGQFFRLRPTKPESRGV
jgi:hypothetical protein